MRKHMIEWLCVALLGGGLASVATAQNAAAPAGPVTVDSDTISGDRKSVV